MAKRILTPAQQNRLRQIANQVDGLYSFIRADVQGALHLTGDQKARVAELEIELSPPTRGRGPGRIGPIIPPPARPPTPEAAAAETKRQHEFADKVIALLTAEQKKVWETLVGQPFVVQR